MVLLSQSFPVAILSGSLEPDYRIPITGFQSPGFNHRVSIAGKDGVRVETGGASKEMS
jgi:hypothetical protein